MERMNFISEAIDYSTSTEARKHMTAYIVIASALFWTVIGIGLINCEITEKEK